MRGRKSAGREALTGCGRAEVPGSRGGAPRQEKWIGTIFVLVRVCFVYFIYFSRRRAEQGTILVHCSSLSEVDLYKYYYLSSYKARAGPAGAVFDAQKNRRRRDDFIHRSRSTGEIINNNAQCAGARISMRRRILSRWMYLD